MENKAVLTDWHSKLSPSKAIYRLRETPIKVTIELTTILKKKKCMETQIPQVTKASKGEKIGGIILPDFKLCYEATVAENYENKQTNKIECGIRAKIGTQAKETGKEVQETHTHP